MMKRLFANSSLNAALKEEKTQPCGRKLLPDDDQVPVFLLGDPAFPLKPYVMKEYANGVQQTRTVLWHDPLPITHGNGVLLWQTEGKIWCFAWIYGY